MSSDKVKYPFRRMDTAECRIVFIGADRGKEAVPYTPLVCSSNDSSNKNDVCGHFDQFHKKSTFRPIRKLEGEKITLFMTKDEKGYLEAASAYSQTLSSGTGSSQTYSIYAVLAASRKGLGSRKYEQPTQIETSEMQSFLAKEGTFIEDEERMTIYENACEGSDESG